MHDGSQNNGFEELVCQLAHLERPSNGKSFQRKEGAGGDAGVECFWILENEQEHAWQAKYFIGEMTSSRWSQLDESFSTALKKHPRMTKYFVCVPFDRTDSRKTGKSGRPVTSIQDQWDKRVKTWDKLAVAEGRKIEFEFWGKHEIELFLGKDDPLYSGRSLYWFNEPFLNSQTFERIVESAKESLGERFTPEYHVDLPIAHQFEGLCLHDSWWDAWSKELRIGQEKADEFFQKFLTKPEERLDQKLLTDFRNSFVQKWSELRSSIKSRNTLERYTPFKEQIGELVAFEKLLRETATEECSYGDSAHKERNLFDDFFDILDRQSRKFSDRSFRSATTRCVLVTGGAGVGKSHLLCDLSLGRIEAKLPTLFLLGQHYQGGDPKEFIRESLDLKNYRNEEVLGALNAAGEAHGTRALIVIDAINEGPYRDEWTNFLTSFLSDISGYKHVALLLSCRTTYLTYMLPDTVTPESLVQIRHNGFSGFEHRAASIYLSKQGIVKPSAPIIAPEFSNPLFLKICCKALKSQGLTFFPKGLQGMSALFDFYLESIEKTIAKRKKYSPTEKLVTMVLSKFASYLFPDDIDGLPFADARKLINEVDPNPQYGDGLFEELLHESVIAEDISYKKTGER